MVVIKHYTPSLCWLAPQQDSQRLGGNCTFLMLFSGSASRSLWGDCYVHSKPCSACTEPEIPFARAAKPAQEWAHYSYPSTGRAKIPKRGDFRVERKKLLPCPFTLQRPTELQAVAGRCVTSAAAVTDCNPEDEEMLSEASFLSHYTVSGRKPSCWTGELPQMSQVLLASHSHVSMWE